MPLIRELLQKQKKESDKLWRDRLWLLSARLGCSFGELNLRADTALSRQDARWMISALKKRKKGEPLQYIAGTTNFFGHDLILKKGVLIPRPETERLVELVLERFSHKENLSVLDIGTGSGAIAIALKLAKRSWCVSASDISNRALVVAQKNAEKLSAAIDFYRADLFSKSLQNKKIHLVVSNPPYLDFRKDRVQKEVLKYEPTLALQPGKKYKVKGLGHRGAWHAQRILLACAKMPETLRPGHCFFELSPATTAVLEKTWKTHPLIISLERLPDLTGRKRFLLVAWKNG